LTVFGEKSIVTEKSCREFLWSGGKDFAQFNDITNILAQYFRLIFVW
jgi:hypothetical protein